MGVGYRASNRKFRKLKSAEEETQLIISSPCSSDKKKKEKLLKGGKISLPLIST